MTSMPTCYSYVRPYWTCFGLPANFVEDYILLFFVLHIVEGQKSTWDMKLALIKSSGLSFTMGFAAVSKVPGLGWVQFIVLAHLAVG